MLLGRVRYIVAFNTEVVLAPYRAVAGIAADLSANDQPAPEPDLKPTKNSLGCCAQLLNISRHAIKDKTSN